MSSFLNKRLSQLNEYVPGEQLSDKDYIKLNTNESPFPPSDGVIRAINSEEIKDLRLYPEPDCKRLKIKLAEIYSVKAENIFCSNGSDDILNFAFMAYGNNGVAFPDITYGFYPVFAELNNIKQEIIPLENNFTIDIEKYKSLNKLIVIANPNAPTGIFLSLDKIEELLKTNCNNIVLVDEAYVDFGAESCYKFIEKYKNLLVVRTYSKSRSMAGARLGFAIADKEVIKDLEKIKFSTNPYDINRLTQVAGYEALKENEYYVSNCFEIQEIRKYVTEELNKLGFTVLNSLANFVFIKSDYISGQDLYLKLKENGILIRHFNSDRIKNYNRVTIGSLKQMQIFINIVKKIVGEKNEKR